MTKYGSTPASRPDIIELCESKFTEAFWLNNAAIAGQSTTAGLMEVVFLDPIPTERQEASRFVLDRGGLDWRGLELNHTGDTYNVRFILTEYFSGPTDTRPIERMQPSDLAFVQVYTIADDSSVRSAEIGKLGEESVDELFDKLSTIQVAKRVPNWDRHP